MAALKEGYKVKLVAFSPDHGEKAFEWYYDVAYKLFFREFDRPLSGEECKNFDALLRSSGIELLTIIEKETNRVIGLMTHTCLKRKSGVAKLGILLDQSIQHKTYAIEAILILLDYLYYRLNFNKVIVEFLADDAHVRRISEKGGWSFEAVLKDEALVDGKYADEVRYYLFKERYLDLYGNYFSDPPT